MRRRIKNSFSHRLGIFITKSLTWNGLFCFITNHFGLHPFAEGAESLETGESKVWTAVHL